MFRLLYSFTKTVSLSSIPTFELFFMALILFSDFVAWHGRYSVFDSDEFMQFMDHTVHEIEGDECTVGSECCACNVQQGLIVIVCM